MADGDTLPTGANGELLLTRYTLRYLWQKFKAWVDNKIATDTDYGMVKTNQASGITLNEAGQLEVGGRLGVSANSGVYYPATINPTKVNACSFLITEASGISLTSKSLGIVTGSGITLKSSAPAGSTSYTVANTYINRLSCAGLQTAGAVAALNENEAAAGNVVKVTSCTINGATFTPDDTSAEGDIVITVDSSANPNSAATNIRFYANAGGGFSDLFIGQFVGTGSSGASVIVGQKVFSVSGNACAIVGADIYNKGNGNGLFGRQHVSAGNRWFMSGTGHNNTRGRSESGAAVGQWSDIDSHTLFVVGNGTKETARSNAFEVTDDEGAVMALATIDELVLKSPNGTSWKISVGDDGTLSASAA